MHRFLYRLVFFAAIVFIILSAVAAADMPEWLNPGTSFPGFIVGIGKAKAIDKSLSRGLSELWATENTLIAIDGYLKEQSEGKLCLFDPASSSNPEVSQSTAWNVFVSSIEVKDQWIDESDFVWTLCLFPKSSLPQMMKRLKERELSLLQEEIDGLLDEYMSIYISVVERLKKLQEETDERIASIEKSMKTILPDEVYTSVLDAVGKDMGIALDNLSVEEIL